MTKLFSIRDVKSDAFMAPFAFRSVGEAIRAFSDTLKDEKNTMAKHPEDFFLFHIGEYDDTSGVITPLEPIKALGCAIDFKEVK